MIRYLRALRLKELVPKTGFVGVGALMAVCSLEITHLSAFVEIISVSLICGVSVFSVNAWAGYEKDSVNNRLADLTAVPRSFHGQAGIISTIVGLAWLITYWNLLTVLGVSIIVLWHLYSMDGGLKMLPIGGVFTAFSTQMLQFTFGYYFIDPHVSSIAWALALYFSLLVSAGHLIHEFIDYEADLPYTFSGAIRKLNSETLLTFSLLLFILSIFVVGLSFSMKWIESDRFIFLSFATLPAVILHPKYIPWSRRNIFIFRRIYLIGFSLSLFLYALTIFNYDF